MMKIPVSTHSLNRRNLLLASGLGLIGAVSFTQTMRASPQIKVDGANDDTLPRNAPGFDLKTESEWKSLSKAEWKDRLSSKAYSVLRRESTERAFTSPLNEEKREGWYACAGCGLILFSSQQKYESGTGWPSFKSVIPGRVNTKADRKLIYVRTEYHCTRCGGHQGHVFDDGPAPTYQRWCNNGVALVFIPEEDMA